MPSACRLTHHLCAGCVSLPEAEEVAAALDGSDGKSWHLPLYPLTTSSLECHAPGGTAQRQASPARKYSRGARSGLRPWLTSAAGRSHLQEAVLRVLCRDEH